MKSRRFFPVLLTILLIGLPFVQLFSQTAFEECTAGVASGRATTDGRPLLWKTRDADAPNNEVIWNTTGKYHFVSVISAGSPGSSWMGVNEKGFSIINTLSNDLTPAKTGLGNGQFMAEALRTCATVDEFEEMLKRTNKTGRTTRTNFGVIDATGAAAFFETAGTVYWKIDAEDTENGYVLRTNFAENGARESGEVPYSMDRYIQTETLMKDFYATDKIEFKEILRTQVRSFGTHAGDLVDIPYADSYEEHDYGYFPNNSCICRNSSVSFSVIHGVLPGEAPELSTMWTILGQPATGVAVPYWPVGDTPDEADGPKTAPLCDAANNIRQEVYGWFEAETLRSGNVRPLYIDTFKLRNEQGNGIWSILFPAEDTIIKEAEYLLSGWRNKRPLKTEMLKAEQRFARQALDAVNRAYGSIKN